MSRIAKKITEEKETKYVGAKGSFCPYCGSKSIYSLHPELTDSGVDVEVECGDCEKSWTDYYNLAGIVETEKKPKGDLMAKAAVRGRKPDIVVTGGGSLYLLDWLTAVGKAWMEEHLPKDATCFGESVAVEHRYIHDIVRGMVADGLRVQ